MPELEPELPPVLPPAPAPLPRPQSPLLARLLNLFALPGHVFEEVRASRHSMGNWLVPTVLCCVALAVSGYVVVSVPSMGKSIAKLRERQVTALDEAVKAGKITQADADLSLKAVDALIQPAALKAIAAGGGLVWGGVRLFWWSFVLWLLARAFLRSPIPYGKAMEVAGLSSMIALLSTVVMLVLTVNVGETLGRTGFSLSVTDITAPGHQKLASLVLNGVNFWLVFVLGTGLARLTQAPWFRATFLIVTYWLVSDLLLLLIGAGSMAG